MDQPMFPLPTERLAHQKILDLFFPPRCAGWRRAGSWICRKCWPAVQWVQPGECTICRSRSPTASICAACHDRDLRLGMGYPLRMKASARFQGTARKAIHELKYSGHFDIATVLGPLMAGLVQGRCCLVPVPLHSSRRRARGFNQSEILARQMARRLADVAVSTSLKRVRKTEDQVGLDGQRRLENVAGAFRWTGRPLVGPVVVVDDVYTTGATLHACARALRASGMKDISAVVFACAARPGASTS